MKYIKITQIRSSIGCLPKHKAILLGLGLRRIGHTVLRENTFSIRSMINIIYYLLKIEVNKCG